LVNALSPSAPFSFPYPLFFTQPKGSDALDPAGLLINIIHVSTCEATCINCSLLSQYTHPQSQKSESFAIRIDSSMLVDLIIDATGQNTSS